MQEEVVYVLENLVYEIHKFGKSESKGSDSLVPIPNTKQTDVT